MCFDYFRLCQSEMSFLIAQSIRLCTNDEEYLNMAPLITELPMPDDYLLEEVQRIAAAKIALTDRLMFKDLKNSKNM